MQCLPTFAFSDNIQFIMKDVGTPTSVSDIETGRSNSTIFAIIYFHLYNWYLQARVSLYKLMCCVLSHSNPIYVDSHGRDKFHDHASPYTSIHIDIQNILTPQLLPCQEQH